MVLGDHILVAAVLVRNQQRVVVEIVVLRQNALCLKKELPL